MGEKYIFKNLLGEFVFDEKFDIVKNPKTKALQKPDKEEIKKILPFFRQNQFFNKFYEQNLKLAKQEIKKSVKKDNLAIQTINHIDELQKVCNVLVKRLREWYELYNPEFSKAVKDHEKFVELMLENPEKTKDSMGADFEKTDLNALMIFARKINDLYVLKKEQEKYLEKTMQQLCPNMTAIAGSLIGAKLLSIAGSFKRLAGMPASVIQLLGAEKALFRHMRTGARSPRHGVIVQHLLLAEAPQKMHGKIARTLADKISIAVKVDYFKGEFIGEKLRKDLEKRFKDKK